MVQYFIVQNNNLNLLPNDPDIIAANKKNGFDLENSKIYGLFLTGTEPGLYEMIKVEDSQFPTPH